MGRDLCPVCAMIARSETSAIAAALASPDLDQRPAYFSGSSPAAFARRFTIIATAFVRRPPRLHALKAIHGPKGGPVGDPRRFEPRLHRAHVAGGFAGAKRDADPPTGTLLVVLGLTQDDDQPGAGILDVADVERNQF